MNVPSEEGTGIAVPRLLLRLGEIQIAMREAGLEGWLLYDYRAQNRVAQYAFGLEELAPTRRFFVWIPENGMPLLIAHAIEADAFGAWPGDIVRYLDWTSLRAALEKAMPRRGTVAMEHQGIGGNPDLSRVDAGTVELVQSYGPRVVSSIDLVNRFLGPWSVDDEASYMRGLAELASIERAAIAFFESEKMPFERELRNTVERAIDGLGLMRGAPVIVTSGPHTRVRAERDRHILARELVAIEVVFRATRRTPWVHHTFNFALEELAPNHRDAFAVASESLGIAIEMVETRARRGERLLGFEVDEAARVPLLRSGATVLHRTGHHLGWTPRSGDACTFDGFEIHDTREALTGHAWSIHPGVYRESFGVRATASVLRTETGAKVLHRGVDIRIVGRHA